jgi:hypothetical protein
VVAAVAVAVVAMMSFPQLFDLVYDTANLFPQMLRERFVPTLRCLVSRWSVSQRIGGIRVSVPVATCAMMATRMQAGSEILEHLLDVA